MHDLGRQNKQVPGLRGIFAGLDGNDTPSSGYIDDFHFVVPVERVGVEIFGDISAINGVRKGKLSVGFGLMHDRMVHRSPHFNPKYV